MMFRDPEGNLINFYAPSASRQKGKTVDASLEIGGIESCVGIGSNYWRGSVRHGGKIVPGAVAEDT
jgi:hypothetical protein